MRTCVNTSASAYKKGANRKSDKIKPTKAVQQRYLDVLLLKPVAGLGEAGEIVRCGYAMFENALQPQRKARQAGTKDIRLAKEAAAARKEAAAPPAIAVHDGVFSATALAA